MTRDEKNRKIAEWLGDLRGYDCQMKPLDFFTDEAANALILDKMPQPSLIKWQHRIYNGRFYWACMSDINNRSTEVEDPDRKTAICEAALKLIEKPKEQG